MAVGLVVVGTALPARGGVADNKTFTVTVAGTDGAAPDVDAGDADGAITVTITNTSASQALNSANIGVPAPFTVVSAPADAVPGGPVVELRNLALAPGTSRAFPIVVGVGTCAPTTPAPFSASAKQSNDYAGAGNDFTLAGPSDLQVDVVGRCRLAFVRQPGDATRGSAITSVDFEPSGAPIAVEVRDAGDSGRASAPQATVSLAATSASVPAPNLQGTTAATSTGGLASFSPGPTLDVGASDYTLTATGPGLLASAPSTPFAIADDRVACLPDQACAEPATATKDGQTVSVDFGSGTSSTDLVVFIDPADAPTFECAGYPREPGRLVSQFLFRDDLGGDRLGTMTVTVPDAGKPLRAHQVCWAAPYDFTTSSGAPAGVQGVKPGTDLALRVGLLPDCAKRSTASLPCVSARTYDRRTRSVAITVRTTGDDPWRY